jgi:hypothetical protein
MNNIEGVSQSEPPHLTPAVSQGVGVRDLGKVIRTGTTPPKTTRDDVDKEIRARRSGSATDQNVKAKIKAYRQSP